MAKAKTENYTPEMTATIVQAYLAAPSDKNEASFNARQAVIETLAEKFGKPVKSVRSKLVSEKVYIGKSAKSKVTGETPEKKEVIAQRIADVVGSRQVGDRMVSLNADSLAKANKSDLSILFMVLNETALDEVGEEAEEADEEADEES